MRPTAAEVVVDPAQMKQLILNLIQNALSAMENVRGPRVLRLVARRQEGAKILEVSDTGVGISAERQKKIFDSSSSPSAREERDSASPS